MGDVVVFDTQSDTAELVVKNIPGLLALCSFGNQAASVGGDTVIVLGMDEDRVPTQIVEFKKGSRMLKGVGKI